MSSGHRFFEDVSNCWLNSYGKFGGATRRRFFAICEKPEGGGADNRPPGRARVKTPLGVCLFYTDACCIPNRELLSTYRYEPRLPKSINRYLPNGGVGSNPLLSYVGLLNWHTYIVSPTPEPMNPTKPLHLHLLAVNILCIANQFTYLTCTWEDLCAVTLRFDAQWVSLFIYICTLILCSSAVEVAV